ncbi:hypothetical protein BDV18DRAFT_78567 [Aspergillus unguis]
MHLWFGKYSPALPMIIVLITCSNSSHPQNLQIPTDHPNVFAVLVGKLVQVGQYKKLNNLLPNFYSNITIHFGQTPAARGSTPQGVYRAVWAIPRLPPGTDSLLASPGGNRSWILDDVECFSEKTTDRVNSYQSGLPSIY